MLALSNVARLYDGSPATEEAVRRGVDVLVDGARVLAVDPHDPGRSLGSDDVGVLAPGRRADLLVCDGDVLERPELLDQGALVEVVKDGEGYRDALSGVPQRRFADGVRRLLRGDLRDPVG